MPEDRLVVEPCIGASGEDHTFRIRGICHLPHIGQKSGHGEADATSSAAAGGDSRLVPVGFAVLPFTLICAGQWITRAAGLVSVRSRGPARLLAK